MGNAYFHNIMLQRLTVRNYALIDRLEVDWSDGMNIITGETGAGKSIVLGALGLILGQRAESDALLDRSVKCIVEGTFRVGKSAAVKSFLAENELDASDPVLVRREVSPEGKSRSFINDTPVNLQQLREFTGLLVDIHSQHQTLLLNKADFQLSVLDALAGNAALLEEYRHTYRQWISTRAEVHRLEELEQKAAAEADYLRFQYTELEEAALKQDEQESLEKELGMLTNAGDINLKLEQATSGLTGGDSNLVSALTGISQQLQSLSKYDEQIRSLSERMKSTVIELKDIAGEADRIAGAFTADPARMEQVEQRLDVIYRLQKKHRVNTVAELLALGQEWSEKLGAIESVAGQLEAARTAGSRLSAETLRMAEALSERRRNVVPKTEKQIRSLLKDVALPNGSFEVSLTPDENSGPGPDGIDRVRFLFSANKGVAPTEIGKAASGGELSRLMLCIKSAVGESMELPTLIFDEIDTGISGETALKIGEVMHRMSKHHQLITITHLPQIASRGSAHYFVRKQVTGKKTLTEMVALSSDERVVEIARMLSGDKPTASALATAKDLLNR
ncbi:MAG: hypothetical protein RL213_2046 [Bacteroidota bacterium]